MLQLQQYKSTHKKYSWPRIEPGTSHTKNRHSTTQLFRTLIPMLIIQFHFKQIAI